MRVLGSRWMRRIGDGLLLAAIVIFGAVLRFGGLAIPSLWLDEILDYDVATKLTHEPLWRWLTGFASEHGPLFFATRTGRDDSRTRRSLRRGLRRRCLVCWRLSLRAVG